MCLKAPGIISDVGLNIEIQTVQIFFFFRQLNTFALPQLLLKFLSMLVLEHILLVASCSFRRFLSAGAFLTHPKQSTFIHRLAN